jgi:putative ABC transport system permease protein
VENRPVILGRPFSVIDEEQGQRVCLIDEDLRDELRLDHDCIGDTILLGSNAFRIVGVIEKRPEMTIGGGMNRDNFEIQIPFSTNKKLQGRNWIWAIATSKSTDVSEEAQAEINFFLRRTRGIRPGDPDTFRVMSIESELKKFNEIAGMITSVASGIVGISLLVGGVGIMNIMLVSVSERTREIGLRKAVGAKKSAILTQFLVEAVVLCFIGGLVGLGFGQLITLSLMKAFPLMNQTHIPPWAIVLSFAFAGSVGLFFGIFPAAKAAQLDPIEALRHE